MDYLLFAFLIGVAGYLICHALFQIARPLPTIVALLAIFFVSMDQPLWWIVLGFFMWGGFAYWLPLTLLFSGLGAYFMNKSSRWNDQNSFVFAFLGLFFVHWVIQGIGWQKPFVLLLPREMPTLVYFVALNLSLLFASVVVFWLVQWRRKRMDSFSAPQEQ